MPAGLSRVNRYRDSDGRFQMPPSRSRICANNHEPFQRETADNEVKRRASRDDPCGNVMVQF